MFKEIGTNSVRLGFSWARMFPDKTKTLDMEVVSFYHDILKEFKQNELKVVMTLFHFYMPKWAIEMGGWESSEVVDMYGPMLILFSVNLRMRFICMQQWMILIVPIHGGYLYGFTDSSKR